MNISKKAFVGDMLINMFASAVPVVILNIIIYPILAAHLSTDNYGTLTTCVGLINFVNGIWGSSVAYTRLLDKSEGLRKKNYSALLILCGICAIFMNIGMLCFTGCILADISIPLLSLCIILIIINNYLVVEYRLILSYKRILISNIFSSVGYCLGLLLLVFTEFRRWEWIFIFGYSLAVIYNLITTSIWKGKVDTDENFIGLLKSTGILVISSSLSGASTYLDKLIIYPMLGATMMAYYQTASIIAKIIPMFATAISNVLLSYLVKINIISKKTYWMYLCVLIVLSFSSLVLCNFIVPPIISKLYSGYYEESITIIPYTNIIAILHMFYSFIFPLSLRYAERSKQYYIQLGRLIPYVMLGVVLIRFYGLIGFCLATIISQVIQIIIVILTTLISLKRIKNNGTV